MPDTYTPSTPTPADMQTPAREAPRARRSGKPSAVDVHIGKRLRQRRMMIGLSQEEVAAAIGVAFQQIQKYECAVNRVSTSRLWALGAALQCPMSFFYKGMTGKTSADAASEPRAEDVSQRQETLKLVRAYSSIKLPETRRQILELAQSLACRNIAIPPAAAE